MRGRNSLPLFSLVPQPQSRSNSPGPGTSFEVYSIIPPIAPKHPIPTIRLQEATPSPDTSANAPFTVSPSLNILAPKESQSPRKKLVPKKSKLALLTSRASSGSKTREKDLSDVVRRVDGWSMDEDGACNITVNGGNARGKGLSRNHGSSRSTIDICVDPSDDPDIGEIVVVKKKKSRAGLDGIRWAFGDVTNNSGGESSAITKPKGETEKIRIKLDEKEKWWSIGRARRDTKEKEKEKQKEKEREKEKEKEKEQEKEKEGLKGQLRRKVISTSAVPNPPAENRQPEIRPRNRSLDSGSLLAVPSAAQSLPPLSHQPTQTPVIAPLVTVQDDDYFSRNPTTQSWYASQNRTRTGSTPGLLRPPDVGYSSVLPNDIPEPEDKGGSLAVRAMRSVRSLARIGSWAQLKNTPAPIVEPAEKQKKRKKDKTKKKEGSQRIKSSSSSWEVGAPSTAGDDTTTRSRYGYGTMAALGIGLPLSQGGPRRDSAGTLLSAKSDSSNAYRTSSSSSGLSIPTTRAPGKRLSVSSADSGPGSTYTASGEDNTDHTGGYGKVLKKKPGSIKWGDVLVGGEPKDMKRDSRDSKRGSRDTKRESKESKRDSKESKRDSKESKRDKREKEKEKEKRDSGRSLEGRKRTPVTSIFPELVKTGSPEESEQATVHVAVRVPVPTISPAFPSRGRPEEKSEAPVPAAIPRPRPVSEQMLGVSRPRPRGIVGSVEIQDAAAFSILEAANSDLASLIKRLDLEATPDSKVSRSRPISSIVTDPTVSSLLTLGEPESPSARRGNDDSPLKRAAGATASITSLRPYSAQQSRGMLDTSAIHSGGNSTIRVGRVSVPIRDVPPIPTVIGQPIVPWSRLIKEEPQNQVAAPTLRAHKKSTASPTVDEESTQPLQPRKKFTSIAPNVRSPSSILSASGAPHVHTSSLSSIFNAVTPAHEPVVPSSRTFGESKYVLPQVLSGSSSSRSLSTAATPTPSPVHGRAHKGSVIVPGPFVKRAVEAIEENERRRQSVQETPVRKKKPEELKPKAMDAGTRRELGFKGTLGVSDAEADAPATDEEDSDIPDELQVILSGHSDDTSNIGKVPEDVVDDTLSLAPSPPKSRSVGPNSSLSASTSSKLPPSPGLPPPDPLPTPSSVLPLLEPSPPAPTLMPFLDPSPSPPVISPPQITVEVHAKQTDVDQRTTSSGSDDDTKKSFDFTGELRRLNESGAAHRRSFVEQLENAFKTPAKFETTELGFNMDKFVRLKGETQDILVEESVDELSDLSKPKASVTSRPSYGRLDTAFKFGGRPQSQVDPDDSENSIARELPGVAALSTSPSEAAVPNNLPPLPFRASSTSMVEEDSSVLRSIYAQAAQNFEHGENRVPLSPALESDTSSKRRVRQSHIPAHARSSSDVSFGGMSSFQAVRTKFEFGPDRPRFFAPSSQLGPSHFKQESVFSMASISSYGEVIKHGVSDPFNYGSLGPEASNKDGLAGADDRISTFEGEGRRKRFSTDSDMSSFYYHAPQQPQHSREHGRNQSVVSTNSMNGPPISLYNRSFGHNRSDSTGSASSIAHAYGVQGANGGRAAWVKHRRDRSIDSVMSQFSAMRLGRPGVGDKMFESAADHAPLTSISASPPESMTADLEQRPSYDSILDGDQRSTIDSIFDRRTSASSDSLFGYDTNDHARGNLFPPSHLRPLSMITIADPGTPHEDDTMISMLGGGHVRRRSIGSSFEASPCIRVEKREKRKHSEFAPRHGFFDYEDGSPNKARLVHRDSVASSASSSKSYKFGENRMSLAQRGLLHRNSLEDSALSGEGEDDYTGHLVRSPIFTRPTPRSHQRPLVTISQPPDTTPPLSSSEGSQSGGSQSSIDIARLKVLLQTASKGSRSANVRARARGHGHRRRPSQTSHSSVIDTIHEENPGLSNSPSPNRHANRSSLSSVSSNPPSPRDPPTSAEPSVDVVEWDEEKTVIGLRKYYALRNEADETISHSKLVWVDTPFSLHALQTFTPPSDPEGMNALLEHSQKNYLSLPSDLRPCRGRARTSSMNRTSPYPRPFSHSQSSSSIHSRRSSIDKSVASSFDKSRALQPLSISQNLSSPTPALAALAPFSPLLVNLDRAGENPPSVIKPLVRPRVGSAARRTALGWTKRKTPKATEGKSTHANKENEIHGLLTSPTESLRIVRPRPRGRINTPGQPTPRSIALHA